MAYSNGNNGFKFFGAEHLSRFSPHHKSSLKGSLGKKSDEALASHRKNIQALSEAGKVAAEVMQTISQLQGKFMNEAFERMNEMMKEFTKTAMNPDALKKHSQSVKEHISKGLEHQNKIVKVAGESQKKIVTHLQDHLKETFREAHVKASKKTASAKGDEKTEKKETGKNKQKRAASASTGSARPSSKAPTKKTAKVSSKVSSKVSAGSKKKTTSK